MATARTLVLLLASVLVLFTIFWFTIPSYSSSLINFHGLESGAIDESFTNNEYADKVYYNLGDPPQPAVVHSHTPTNFHYEKQMYQGKDSVHKKTALINNLQNFEVLPSVEEVIITETDAGTSNTIKETECIIALTNKNFSNFVTENKYVAVHLYLSWSNWSYVQSLEYAAASTMLEGKVVFAKVDASLEKELAKKLRFVGCSTLYFFIHGLPLHTYRQCCKRDVVVDLLKEKMKGGVYSVTKPSHARDILKIDSIIILALLHNLEGPDSEEFAAAASKLGNNVTLYQTTRKDIPTIFNIDPQIKRPALFMLRKDAKKFIQFDAPFTRSVIADFVSKNNFPMITTFNAHNALPILMNKLKQLWVFATDDEIDKVMPAFKGAAEAFNGQLLFVYIKRDHKYITKQLSYDFGDINEPKVIAYSGFEAILKCMMNGELSLSNLKSFGKHVLREDEQCVMPIGSSYSLFYGLLEW